MMLGLSFDPSRRPAPGAEPTDDAIGLWYGTRYSTSPRPHIPNAAQRSAAAPKNLVAWPRRQFTTGGNCGYSASGSVTVADSVAVGSDGLTEASTLVMGSGATFSSLQSVSLDAGTYTIVVEGKSSDGGTYTIRFGQSATAGQFSTVSFGASFVRHAHTFTIGSTTTVQPLVAWAQAGAANITICDFGIYAGASDPGADPVAGHMILGSSATAGLPTYSSGVLDFSSSAQGQIQFGGSQSSNVMTACAVLKKVAAGSTINAIYGDRRAYTTFSAMMETTQSGARGFELLWGGTSNNTIYYNGDIEDLLPDFRLLTWRYDQSHFSLFADDVLMLKEARSGLSTREFRDLVVACAQTFTVFSSGYSFAGGAMWVRALTDTEVRRVFDIFKTKLTGNVALAKSQFIIASEGDSLSALSESWFYRYVPNANPSTLCLPKAVSGSSFSGLNSRAALVDSTIWADAIADGRKFILTVLTGANDLASIGASSYLTQLSAYCDARRAAGWLVALCTPLPQSSSSFNTARAGVLSTMRTWVGTHCDALIDFAADPVMGPDAAGSNTSLYYDGLHPTGVTGQPGSGCANLEAIARPVLNELAV